MFVRFGSLLIGVVWGTVTYYYTGDIFKGFVIVLLGHTFCIGNENHIEIEKIKKKI